MSSRPGDHSSSDAARILIVEDDPEVAGAVAEMIRHLGYVPCICDRADEVLCFIKTNKVDLILVDYRLPELTGLDLIRMLEQDNRHIPVVMMTGYAQTESRIPAEKRREFILLKKPITAEPLARALEESLKAVAPAP